jgi:hypothetical protein
MNGMKKNGIAEVINLLELKTKADKKLKIKIRAVKGRTNFLFKVLPVWLIKLQNSLTVNKLNPKNSIPKV